MKKYKSNVVGCVKVLGNIYNYGDVIEVAEEDEVQITNLITTKQIVRVYD